MSIIINTERLNLKKIEKKDLKVLVNHLNNWNVVKWLVNVPYPYTFNDAEKWLEKSSKEELALNIFHKNNLIGGITIDKRTSNNTPVLGYWIGEDYWGKGYALEACNSLISYFFSNHSGNILYASHMFKNEKSKKILLNLGFQKVSEGKVFSLSKNIEVGDVNYELVNS
tara:strand:- start:1794 stop:2300 length:507 start_codon:yes stop_codon:yes gene_type:complete